MTPSRRWWLVAAATVAVVGLPIVAGALPVRGPQVTAAALLASIRSSARHAYSGQVQLAGNLDLPVTSRFTDVGALLGGATTLRVWWRSPSQWRVDKTLVTGETDLIHDGGLTTQWRYDQARAVRSVDPEVRLPRTADLLPPVLAARVLVGVTDRSVSRVPARRVAGIAAPGLRVAASDPRSSIDHVDLWSDPATGLVLRLDAYAAGDTAPSFTTAFDSFSADRPVRARTRFVVPQGASVTFDDVLDIADAADQYAPFSPPATVAGLARAARPQGAVGVYGTGLTRLLVIPLRHGDAETLRDQVRASAGATESAAGVALRSGPLGVLVSEHREASWLVTGPVTEQTLVDAADDLAVGTVRR